MRVDVGEPRRLTPHNEALYDAGHDLLVSSVEVGRDFCRTMIPIATGAIPIYLALVGLAVGKDHRFSLGEALLALASPACFLVAAAAFSLGYFPVVKQDFSLEIFESIEEARSATVKRRYAMSKLGFILLAAGIVVGFGALIALLPE